MYTLPSTAAASCLLAGLLSATSACAADGPLPAPAPASQPASRPAGPVHFQPGIRIHWRQPAVVVDSRVVLREGALEFFACRPGKEHESILRLEAPATHIYLALGLIGLLPGSPPAWNEARDEYARPTGDLVEISCEWEVDGRDRRADAYEWLSEVDYARPPIPRPWVFAGSLQLPDGTLAADQTGAVVALVDFPESLLAQSRPFPSRYGELWAEANTPAIPPIGTPVRLVLRPARRRERMVMLDFRGEAYVDGRYVTTADLADLLRLDRQLDPDHVQTLRLHGTLQTDAARLRRELADLGVPREVVRFDCGDAGTVPATRPATQAGSVPVDDGGVGRL